MKTIRLEANVDADGVVKIEARTGLPPGPVDVELSLVRKGDVPDPVHLTPGVRIRLPSDQDIADDLLAFDEEVEKKSSDAG
jgi:hypothetical protein